MRFFFIFLLFLGTTSKGSAQVALANFGPDQKPVGIFMKTSGGEALKLGDFPVGQATGFMNLEPRQTEFIFEHPTLGKSDSSTPFRSIKPRSTSESTPNWVCICAPPGAKAAKKDVNVRVYKAHRGIKLTDSQDALNFFRVKQEAEDTIRPFSRSGLTCMGRPFGVHVDEGIKLQ
jgi:hypothetical protein